MITVARIAIDKSHADLQLVFEGFRTSTIGTRLLIENLVEDAEVEVHLSDEDADGIITAAIMVDQRGLPDPVLEHSARTVYNQLLTHTACVSSMWYDYIIREFD